MTYRDGLVAVAGSGWVLVGWRVVGQGIEQFCDGVFQWREVFVDGGREDGVGGVEVAVGEVVAHSGDLAPRDLRLGCEEILAEGLDSLADLQQPDPDGVEDQPIRQAATLDVGADRVNGGLDVLQALRSR